MKDFKIGKCLKDSINNFRKNGKIIGNKFLPSKKFINAFLNKNYSLDQNEKKIEINFKNHVELDNFIEKLLVVNKNEGEVKRERVIIEKSFYDKRLVNFKGEKMLLKCYDRAFWLRFYIYKSDDYKPKISSNDFFKKSACPLFDPNQVEYLSKSDSSDN
jgi:hypothetical protein